jgi:hypothetical protein
MSQLIWEQRQSLLRRSMRNGSSPVESTSLCPDGHGMTDGETSTLLSVS